MSPTVRTMKNTLATKPTAAMIRLVMPRPRLVRARALRVSLTLGRATNVPTKQAERPYRRGETGARSSRPLSRVPRSVQRHRMDRIAEARRVRRGELERRHQRAVQGIDGGVVHDRQ